MTNSAIFHGTGCCPDDFWYPWLKEELELKGYQVWLAQLPDADTPAVDTWRPFVLQHCHFDCDSTLIGHSAGCPLILSILECLEAPVRKIVLVAAFAQPLAPELRTPIVQDKYDWDKIKRNAGEVIVINSDNDPWGCDHRAGQYIIDRLGGTLVVPKGEGHMGSHRLNQPYKKFPLLLQWVTESSL